MAFKPYHNIDGSTGVDVELLAPGDNANNIKSILIANTTASAATVSLFIQNSPTGSAPSTFYMLKNISMTAGSSLLLDSNDMLAFDNSPNGYGLYVTVGGSDTFDISITR